MMLSLCVFILLLSFTYGVKIHHHHTTKIAFATEGKSTEVSEWVKMMSHMEYKSHVTLFLLSYDKPVDPIFCSNHTHIVCVFSPKSTWTTGRNDLTRVIAKYEVEHQRHFKYWLFGDQDMVQLDTCGEATHCHGPEYPQRSISLASCCFDTAMTVLLAPEVQYAIVNFNLWGGGQLVNYIGFSHVDCCDGSLNAFHHAAVPVILPYIELIDKQTWWESQGLQFHLVSSCFPGYSVYSNVFSIKYTTGHSPYPNGRRPDSVKRALDQVYGKAGLIPNPMSVATVQLEQGNCAKLDHVDLKLNGAYEPKIEGVNGEPPLKTLWVSDAWRNMTNFKKCYDALRPRYLSFLETGNLTAIDGTQY